jgi:hypothetical protein
MGWAMVYDCQREAVGGLNMVAAAIHFINPYAVPFDQI